MSDENNQIIAERRAKLKYLDDRRQGIGEALQFCRALFPVDMGVAAGVEFDDRRAEQQRSIELALKRLN